MIIKDKKQKKELNRVPDKDKSGDPIYKIADVEKEKSPKPEEKKSK